MIDSLYFRLIFIDFLNVNYNIYLFYYISWISCLSKVWLSHWLLPLLLWVSIVLLHWAISSLLVLLHLLERLGRVSWDYELLRIYWVSHRWLIHHRVKWEGRRCENNMMLSSTSTITSSFWFDRCPRYSWE
jgi:hypothetical protein